MNIFGNDQSHGLASFDHRFARSFCERTQSESTRRNYRQVVSEFFAFVGGAHPAALTPDDIRMWRDHLIKAGKRPSTVILKLAVVRSFYEYLMTSGIVFLNPASTAAVSPQPAEPVGSR